MIFRKPNVDDIGQIEAFKQEFIDHNSSMDGTGFLGRYSAAQWLQSNAEMETVIDPVLSRALQYGLFDDNGRLLGLLQIRLELKGYLADFGGNIGYCVRPSERNKGYAKHMLACALPVSKEAGLNKVLITCLEDNVASERTILACGGVFEKVVFDDKNYHRYLKRYWVDTGF
jgi:predicted acetyltransferase